MKIAHIVRRFSFDEWGGTESVVWHIARQQKSQGLMPEILCTAALDKVGCEVVDGITIKRFPYFYPYFPMPAKDRLALDKKGGNPFSLSLLKALKNGNYDIFHIPEKRVLSKRFFFENIQHSTTEVAFERIF